jgi:hypothetical protein
VSAGGHLNDVDAGHHLKQFAAVVRAPPDGYTLLLFSASAATNAALYDKRRSDSHCPIRRAVMSLPPPAAKPTMMRTGRVG